jgi:DNA-binding response OmpR family regulator
LSAVEKTKAKICGLFLFRIAKLWTTKRFGLPGMDGREVCRRIKRANKKVKVIFLTGVGVVKPSGLSALCQKFHAEISKELGAVDYITKPFDNEDLVRRVKQALG